MKKEYLLDIVDNYSISATQNNIIPLLINCSTEITKLQFLLNISGV